MVGIAKSSGTMQAAGAEGLMRCTCSRKRVVLQHNEDKGGALQDAAIKRLRSSLHTLSWALEKRSCYAQHLKRDLADSGTNGFQPKIALSWSLVYPLPTIRPLVIGMFVAGEVHRTRRLL